MKTIDIDHLIKQNIKELDQQMLQDVMEESFGEMDYIRSAKYVFFL